MHPVHSFYMRVDGDVTGAAIAERKLPARILHVCLHSAINTG